MANVPTIVLPIEWGRVGIESVFLYSLFSC